MLPPLVLIDSLVGPMLGIRDPEVPHELLILDGDRSFASAIVARDALFADPKQLATFRFSHRIVSEVLWDEEIGDARKFE